MGTLYLITRENIPGDITSFESHFDVNALGSYTSIKYGTDSYYETKEAALNHLKSIARQVQNIKVGYTSYIIGTNGDVIYILQAVVNEYEISTES